MFKVGDRVLIISIGDIGHILSRDNCGEIGGLDGLDGARWLVLHQNGERIWHHQDDIEIYGVRPAEAVVAPGPVRTVTETRTYIEPGQYGRLYVSMYSETNVRVHLGRSDRSTIDAAQPMTSYELRETARTMVSLAEFLESKSGIK